LTEQKFLSRILIGGLIILACWLTTAASAQKVIIRVVCYNIEDDINGATTPLPGLIAPPGGTIQQGGVLEGIGEEILSNDPAQPLDVLALEETTSNPVTVAPIVNGLNTFYRTPGMYAMSPYQATESGGDTADGNGPNALVYNTRTLQLISSKGVDPSGGTSQLGSASGEYREVVCYELALAGVTPTPATTFYLYVSHYKSGTTSADLTDRAGEAAIIRDNEATNLPATPRIICVGDYNISASTEQSYQTMIAALAPNGINQGQGVDPMNPSDASINWATSTTNPTILSEETEEDYDLRYRDDLQISTTNIYYGTAGGLTLVPGTYHVFGNNGTTPYGKNVDTGSNTALNDLETNPPMSASALLYYLTNASDHLPVVADYAIPAPPLTLTIATVTNQPGWENLIFSPLLAEHSYTVQVSTNLVSGVWLPFTNYPAPMVTNGSQLTITDTNAILPQQFYRVEISGP
jgi:hypothetical protein